jgi:hypothetical protein
MRSTPRRRLVGVDVPQFLGEEHALVVEQRVVGVARVQVLVRRDDPVVRDVRRVVEAGVDLPVAVAVHAVERVARHLGDVEELAGVGGEVGHPHVPVDVDGRAARVVDRGRGGVVPPPEPVQREHADVPADLVDAAVGEQVLGVELGHRSIFQLAIQA